MSGRCLACANKGKQRKAARREHASRQLTSRPDPVIPWGQQVCVDLQRIHVMQTSLFRVPEEAAALKAMNAPKRTTFLIDKSLNRKHSRGSDGDSLRAEYREVSILHFFPCG